MASENLPKRKSRKNKPNIDSNQKKLVHNIRDFLTDLKRDIGIGLNGNEMMKKYGNVLKTCAKICEMSKSTVAKILKCENNTENIDEIDNFKVKNEQKSIFKCGSVQIDTLRRIVLDMYVNKSYPSLDSILLQCQKYPSFPKISRSTVWKWMTQKCKITYGSISKKPVHLDSEDIKKQREYYLRKIKQYRTEGYYIIYQDETWASPDMTPSQGWLVELSNDELKDYAHYTENKVLQSSDGKTGGIMVKGGQGRIIINHAGGELGFVQGEGIEDIFVSKKDTMDYHQAMNSEHFKHWFKNLLLAVPTKTVIVLDRAPYHKQRVPNTIMASMNWKKGDIVDNLNLRNIEKPDHVNNYEKMTKKDLINWLNQHPVDTKFEVERLAEECGKEVRILWLPVAHRELNQIELIWSQVKGYISKNNSDGGPQNVLKLSREAVGKIIPAVWHNCVQHCIKIEDEMIERDRKLREKEDKIVSESRNSYFDSSANSSTDASLEI